VINFNFDNSGTTRIRASEEYEYRTVMDNGSTSDKDRNESDTDAWVAVATVLIAMITKSKIMADTLCRQIGTLIVLTNRKSTKLTVERFENDIRGRAYSASHL